MSEFARLRFRSDLKNINIWEWKGTRAPVSRIGLGLAGDANN